jgi:hypothetical protein
LFPILALAGRIIAGEYFIMCGFVYHAQFLGDQGSTAKNVGDGTLRQEYRFAGLSTDDAWNSEAVADERRALSDVSKSPNSDRRKMAVANFSARP